MDIHRFDMQMTIDDSCIKEFAAKIIDNPKAVYIFDSELISRLDMIYIFK